MHSNTKNAAQAISLAGGCRCAVDSCWIPSFAGWGKVVDGMYQGVFNSNVAAGACGNVAEDSVHNLVYQEKAITGWV